MLGFIDSYQSLSTLVLVNKLPKKAIKNTEIKEIANITRLLGFLSLFGLLALFGMNMLGRGIFKGF